MSLSNYLLTPKPNNQKCQDPEIITLLKEKQKLYILNSLKRVNAVDME